MFVAALLFLSPIRVLLCHRFADYSQCPHYNSPLVFVFSSVAVIFQTKRESGRRVSQGGGGPGLPTSTSVREKPRAHSLLGCYAETCDQHRGPPALGNRESTPLGPHPPSDRQCFRRAATKMCIGHPRESPSGQKKMQKSERPTKGGHLRRTAHRAAQVRKAMRQSRERSAHRHKGVVADA